MKWFALSLGLALSAAAEQPLATYPGAQSTRIGNDLIIGGEYYRMAYFVTDDPMPTVARYFEKQWEEAGYPTSSAGEFVDEGVVSAFFTRQGLMRSIVLRKHEGKTLGFSVLKDLWVKAEQVKPDRMPPVEGALVANDLVARGEEGVSQHRSAVFETDLQTTRDGRDRQWVAAGWTRVKETRVTRDGERRPQRVLEYARAGEQAVVTLIDLDGKTTAIDETWVGSPGPKVKR